MRFASRAILVDAPEEGDKWHVRANKMGSNCSSYVYAEPLQAMTIASVIVRQLSE